MNYKQKLQDFENRFKTLMFDYYDGATIINKLIYNQKLMDRYYTILEEFNNLKSGLYSSKHIEKLMNSKCNKTVLVVNIYRSRALGLLSVADAINRLSFCSNGTLERQKTCQDLNNLSKEIEIFANNNLHFANMLARDIDYKEYFDMSPKSKNE